MKPFTNFESRMIKLPINNIDTDQIIPARFLKTTSKLGLDRQLFYDWRQDPDFVLNRPESQGAAVLLAATTSAAAAPASTHPGRSRSGAFAP